MQSLGVRKSVTLLQKIRFNKINWTSGNPYNIRWQYKWKHAYYTYPRDGFQPTNVKKPEDSATSSLPMYTMWQDIMMRIVPGFKTYYARRSRIMDPFQTLVLPVTSIFFIQFFPLALGFKIFTIIPWMLFYTRMRDKCIDPDMKETFLRDMIHQNQQISQLFQVQTIHVLDYNFEYDEGYPCEKKFPQFKNKFWRFFNSDTHMCTGHFKFGDLQSGATMHLKFKTMPIHGQNRYQVGEPFYFYDVRAEITHNGKYKQVILVDENQQLKLKRPFLIII